MKDLISAARFRKRCLEAAGTLQNKLDVVDPLKACSVHEQKSIQLGINGDLKIKEEDNDILIEGQTSITSSLLVENESALCLTTNSTGCNFCDDNYMFKKPYRSKRTCARSSKRKKCEFCGKLLVNSNSFDGFPHNCMVNGKNLAKKTCLNQCKQQQTDNMNIKNNMEVEEPLHHTDLGKNISSKTTDAIESSGLNAKAFVQSCIFEDHLNSNHDNQLNQSELNNDGYNDSDFYIQRDELEHEINTSHRKGIRRKDDRRHKCEICGKGFINSNHLVQHRRIHTGEKPHKCEDCGRAFAQKSHLTAHMKHHTGDFKFKCDTCGKGFIYSNELVIHLRIHTGERPHKCDICGKDFVQGSALTQHMRSHAGERLHQCEVCGKGFVRLGHLTQHLIMHSGERLFKCLICSKGFSRNGYLTQHMLIHNGELTHKCNVCGKGFISRSYLGQHMRFHSDARPHQCEGCGKGFINKAHLKRHMRTHTGEES
ncbi:zinc finger protein 724-like isoform X2 [Malaya genurostris]|nr:zinc finger protein 724-like isoform X2 [Malaya genurostris]